MFFSFLSWARNAPIFAWFIFFPPPSNYILYAIAIDESLVHFLNQWLIGLFFSLSSVFVCQKKAMWQKPKAKSRRVRSK